MTPDACSAPAFFFSSVSECFSLSNTSPCFSAVFSFPAVPNEESLIGVTKPMPRQLWEAKKVSECMYSSSAVHHMPLTLGVGSVVRCCKTRFLFPLPLLIMP